MFIALLKTILGTSYFLLCWIQTVPAETLGSEEMGTLGEFSCSRNEEGKEGRGFTGWAVNICICGSLSCYSNESQWAGDTDQTELNKSPKDQTRAVLLKKWIWKVICADAGTILEKVDMRLKKLHSIREKISRWQKTLKTYKNKLESASPVSRPKLDSPGCVLQVGVGLVEPISIWKLISCCGVRGYFLSVSQPAHFDIFGVEVVDAASQYGRMMINGRLRPVKSDEWFRWNMKMTLVNFATN